MKTSPTTPRTPRKTTTTVAKATPGEKKLTAPRVRRAPSKARMKASPSVDEVRFRAYEIFLHRNGHGDEISDWLQAEQELMA